MTRVQAGPRRPARVSRKALLVFLLGCATTPAIVCVINRTPRRRRRQWRSFVPILPARRRHRCARCGGDRGLHAEHQRDTAGVAGRPACTMKAGRPWCSSRAEFRRVVRTCAVGDAMAQFAVTSECHAAAVRTETTSTTTWENALHSTPYLKALGARRLLLVTDRLHMLRSEAAFARFGFAIERATRPDVPGYRDNVDMLYHGFRERVAYRYYADADGSRTLPLLERRLTVHDTATGNRSLPTRSPRSIRVDRSSSSAPRTPEVGQCQRLAGVPLVNKGITGQQSFELLERFEQDVVLGAAAGRHPLGVYQRHLSHAASRRWRRPHPHAGELCGDRFACAGGWHRADPDDRSDDPPATVGDERGPHARRALDGSCRATRRMSTDTCWN